MKQIRALREYVYADNMRKAGDVFDVASDDDAHTLVTIGHAEYVDRTVKAEDGKAKKPSRNVYQRRDMRAVE